MRRKRSRRLAVGRILQVGLATAVAVFGLMLAASSVGLPTVAGGPTQLSYTQFVQDLQKPTVQHTVLRATLDGNVILAEYDDLKTYRVLSPSPDHSVQLLINKKVPVEAARVMPASGISLPVLGAILLPYALLAYFVIGLVRAAGDGIDIDVADWEPTEPTPVPASPVKPAAAGRPGPAPSELQTASPEA